MKNISSFMIDLSFERKLRSLLMVGLICVSTILALVPLLSVFLYVLKQGLLGLNLNFLTQLPSAIGDSRAGGMANSLLGSCILIVMAAAIGIPVGVFGGVYLSEFGSGKLGSVVRFSVDLLASIPSIVIGLFVYALVVLPMKKFSAIAGSIALSILMIPIVVKTTEEVLKLIPNHIREAGLALGIPRWRVILSIVLKGNLPAVSTGIILAIARISGETAPLLFTAFGNRMWPKSILEPTPSLPVQIYNYAISPFEEWHRQAWAGAVVLIFLVSFFNLVAKILFLKNGRRNE